MIVRSTKDIDGLYALFLGRFPESDLVRQNNIGQEVLDVARELICSKEFEEQVVDRASRHGSLPHQNLSPEYLPGVLDVIAESGLALANQGVAPADWQSVLREVLTTTPCREIIDARYHNLGQQLITVLAEAQPRPRPAERELHETEAGRDPVIVSGIDIIAGTICRGWVIDRNSPRAPLHVQVRVNGLTVRVIPADEFRRDVQDLYGGDGRAGFSLRLDGLPDARYLGRASVEIVEVSRGIVVLPERVVEFSPDRAVRIEAEIREELVHLRGTLDRLEQSLPRLAHGQSWGLALYSSVRACLELVVSPPAVDTQVRFTVVVIDDPNRTGATEQTLASVLAQTREPCEMILVSRADSAPRFSSDRRLEVVRLARDEHPNSAVNSIAARAQGSHLLITDGGTALAPEALAWFAMAIESTRATVIYADQDRVAPNALGRDRFVPLFNPALDRELLLQHNYVGETLCIARSSYVELDGLTCDPSFDARHDLLLRVLTRFGHGAVMHLPLVLMHNPAVDLSGDARAAQARTLHTVQAHLDRNGVAAQAVAHADAIGRAVPGAAKILWEADRTSRISVVIPTQDRADMVFALLSSLRRQTAIWELVEIVVLVNGAPSVPSRYAFSEIEDVFDRAKVVFRQMPFNWGAINNVAVSECAESDVLVFLNDDMVCLTPDWDTRLRSQLARPEIGVIGGRLLYPNGALQHAGVIFRSGTQDEARPDPRFAVHEAMGDDPSDGLYLDRTLLVHETAAVTGAFMACRRAIFESLGGFDAERYTVTFSDTDFCTRTRAQGYSVLYDPFLTWIHYESVSRGRDEHDAEKQRRVELELGKFRSGFAAVDLIDLGLNPHLARSVRPFETFHRLDRETIEAWVQAQLHRRDQWDRRLVRHSPPAQSAFGKPAG